MLLLVYQNIIKLCGHSRIFLEFSRPKLAKIRRISGDGTCVDHRVAAMLLFRQDNCDMLIASLLQADIPFSRRYLKGIEDGVLQHGFHEFIDESICTIVRRTCCALGNMDNVAVK